MFELTLAEIARKIAAGLQASFRLDSSQTQALERDLTAQGELIRDKYDVLKAIRFAPLKEGTAAGAQFVSNPTLSDSGRAEVIANCADDLPIIEYTLDDNKSPVFTIGCAWLICWEDSLPQVEGAAVNIDPFAEKRRGAFEAIMRLVDQICMIGIPLAKLPGLLNNPNVTEVALVNGDWLDPATTALEILADLNLMESSVIDGSGENYYPNMFLVPPLVSSRLGEPMNVGDRTTIWEYFVGASRSKREENIEIQLQTSKFANDVEDGQRGMMYHLSADVLECEVPLMATELEPQSKNLSSKTPVVGRVGGTVIKRPTAVVYSELAPVTP